MKKCPDCGSEVVFAQKADVYYHIDRVTDGSVCLGPVRESLPTEETKFECWHCAREFSIEEVEDLEEL